VGLVPPAALDLGIAPAKCRACISACHDDGVHSRWCAARKLVIEKTPRRRNAVDRVQREAGADRSANEIRYAAVNGPSLASRRDRWTRWRRLESDLAHADDEIEHSAHQSTAPSRPIVDRCIADLVASSNALQTIAFQNREDRVLVSNLPAPGTHGRSAKRRTRHTGSVIFETRVRGTNRA